MKIYSNSDYTSSRPCVIALGCFDGVHIAHAAVIKEARKKATDLGCDCVVWTFDEPPKNFFLDSPVPLITDREQKERAISALGADILVSIPFNRDIANISPEDFFKSVICDKLKALHIVCGFDYSFGKKGQGNVILLDKLCKAKGIGISIIPAVTVNDLTVSSSQIREYLSEGDPNTATLLLGRPYSLRAKVINGQHLARHLGFPTINQEFSCGTLIPKYGVYVTRIAIEKDDRPYFGISNVGIRPTVGGNIPYAETHIFDLSADLYGKTVEVYFLDFIRPEKKFDNIEALTKQVDSDIEIAKKILDNKKTSI